MKKVTAIVWHSHSNVLRQAREKVRDILDIKVYSARSLEEGKEDLGEALADLNRSHMVFIYRSLSDRLWQELEAEVKGLGCPVVCVARDPALWSWSTVAAPVVARCQAYIIQGGEDNFARMLGYLAREVLGMEVAVEEPAVFPWDGIYHPGAPGPFTTAEDYENWYGSEKKPAVGILMSRSNWVNGNLAVEDTLIRCLEEKGLGVIPVFSYSLQDEEVGARGPGAAVEQYYFDSSGKSRIKALIKLLPFFLEARTRREDYLKEQVAASGTALLQRLGVPVFQPVSSYYLTVEEWAADPQGLNQDIPWTVALPEFEGVIEPLFVVGSRKEGDLEIKTPVEDRCRRLAERVAKWMALAQKLAAEKKVAFILHNNPCASVEATVGGGANLDTLESVARILQAMAKGGYKVQPPADGKELIDTIMERKALAEFRWTTVEEIVQKGGALQLMEPEDYRKWFATLSPAVQKRMIEVWGEPPGEMINGVPPAMVYEGKLVITGVSYGNAVVCVQPKRGCAGARCDGQVCKILHDPQLPPPHQYLATYGFLERELQVDVVIHVGTHGNLEFLPGKGVGLSRDCFPDLAIGSMPHLYIYNADNPPEGTIAKRRSYGVLVDHMQTVMVQGGLYDRLADLNRYLEEYEKAKLSDLAQAHVLEHLILEEIRRANLEEQLGVEGGHESFAAVVEKAHALLSQIRNTRIQDGQHIFGELPQGEKRGEFIYSILRFDAGQEVSLRRAVANLMGLELKELLAEPGRISPRHGRSYGALLERVDQVGLAAVMGFIEGKERDEAWAQEVLGDHLVNREALEQLNRLLPQVQEINGRLEASREIEALLSGMDGNYIPAGPSGLITRGRPDILPTGRNFYTLDPHRIPTRGAWEVGRRLADKILEKFLSEEGRYPENVALYWMSNDIMWADGEGLAQMLYLLGVRPRWLANGRVGGLEVIPLEELGRPRIDLTVRVSGIARDNFPNCIELLDEAVQMVANLEEPLDQNYVRRHALEQMEGEGPEAWREATLRIFAAKPGTYQAGVNLAVYASAWKDERDLSEIFIYWNGYAYGKGVYGQEAFGQLQKNLRSVDITYNKVATDESDLFSCCGYFGSHGGMTAAARTVSGKEIKTYYGDTREPEQVEVRTLADEIRRVVRTKLLNPRWIEGQKRHGYKGAGDMAKRIGRVYGWEATTEEVDDWIFDDITRTFVMDEENRRFFKENNPWALEEIARRLMEAQQRGLWQADPQVLAGLREYYLEIEGWLEEKMGDTAGEFQGGAIQILTADEVADWGEKMREIKELLAEKKRA